MPKPPETLGQKAARLQGEVDALTTRLENYASIERRLEEVLAENEILRNGQNSSGVLEAQWRNRSQEAEAKVSQLTEQVANMRREFAAAQGDLGSQIARLTQRAEEAEAAREQVREEAERTVIGLRDALDRATDAARQANQRLTDANTASAEKDRQLGEVRRELDRLRNTTRQAAEEHVARVASLEDQVKVKDQQILRLQDMVTSLNGVAEGWKQRAQQAEAHIAEKDQRAAILDRTVTAQRQRLGDVQEHIARAHDLLQRSL